MSEIILVEFGSRKYCSGTSRGRGIRYGNLCGRHQRFIRILVKVEVAVVRLQMTTKCGTPYNPTTTWAIWSSLLTWRPSPQPKFAARVGVSDFDMPQAEASAAAAAATAAAAQSAAYPPQRPYDRVLQQQLQMFWNYQRQEIEQATDFKNHQLPLARIKMIMKADEDVHMISAETPVLFAKACDRFIQELTLCSWLHAEENKCRTLQKNDIAAAISRTDTFDFLVDIIPRDEVKDEGVGLGLSPGGVPYYYPPLGQLAPGGVMLDRPAVPGTVPGVVPGTVPGVVPGVDPSMYVPHLPFQVWRSMRKTSEDHSHPSGGGSSCSGQATDDSQMKMTNDSQVQDAATTVRETSISTTCCTNAPPTMAPAEKSEKFAEDNKVAKRRSRGNSALSGENIVEDDPKNSKKSNKDGNESNQPNKKFKGKCFNCGKIRHKSTDFCTPNKGKKKDQENLAESKKETVDLCAMLSECNQVENSRK
ncbi:Nuclear transcription factor Y subunit C-4 [Capsicum chinense]|nr:Nuclear transcription factor Y subunit C-4 [Capsicum chinense]